jgi:hypothetical protein
MALISKTCTGIPCIESQEEEEKLEERNIDGTEWVLNENWGAG